MIDRDASAGAESMSKLDHSLPRAAIDREVVLIAIVWAMAIGPTLSALAPPPKTPIQHVVTTIDPNEAPWWEFTALPRIGETLARKLTAFRQQANLQDESQPAFSSPTDLQRVRGIGPKTVRRLAPFLRFQSISVTRSDITSQSDLRPQD